MGHTTRCIPIIRRLLELKCEVVFAGNDHQQTFIAKLFPGIALRLLPGYDVTYGRGALMPALIRALPGLVGKVREEHDWLLSLTQQEEIHGIISDNRYGLWHPRIPSVILTHQAEIKTGLGQWADSLLRRIHYRFLGRFGECWIVDIPGRENLAGTLSAPTERPPRSRYIGWISQLTPPAQVLKERHLLVLLSGPEPQRSLLSDLLWTQACAMDLPIAFVEGSAGRERGDVPAHIRHFPQVAGAELQTLLEEAFMVVCRSGYSTLMDLLLLRKKAILIPTPGQTEQEYLAKSLAARRIFWAAPQKAFSLPLAMEASQHFEFDLPDANDRHKAFIPELDRWVENIGARATPGGSEGIPL